MHTKVLEVLLNHITYTVKMLYVRNLKQNGDNLFKKSTKHVKCTCVIKTIFKRLVTTAGGVSETELYLQVTPQEQSLERKRQKVYGQVKRNV